MPSSRASQVLETLKGSELSGSSNMGLENGDLHVVTTGRGPTGRLQLGAHVIEGPHNIVAKYFPEASANLSRLPLH